VRVASVDVVRAACMYDTGAQDRAERIAEAHLNQDDLPDVFENSGLLWTDTACRATDWQQPDRTRVTDLQLELENAALQSRTGVILLPFWICEYNVGGKGYRAFVNADTGNCVGPSHADSFVTSCVGG
jgi:hypothetical protein